MEKNEIPLIIYPELYDVLMDMDAEDRYMHLWQLLEYAFGGIQPTLPLIKMTSKKVDADRAKYAETSRKRSEGGKKAMAKRWGKRDSAVISEDKSVISEDKSVISEDKSVISELSLDITHLTNNNYNYNNNYNNKHSTSVCNNARTQGHEFLERLKDSPMLLEAIAKNHRKSVEQVISIAETHTAIWCETDKQHRDFSDYVSHLQSEMRINKTKQSEQQRRESLQQQSQEAIEQIQRKYGTSNNNN